MDDLFEQLKAEPPVNKYVRDAPEVKKVTSEITSNTCLSPRRESMPPPTSVVVIQKSNKSRSLSPPKALAASSIKNVKVMIQRKNLANVAIKPTNSVFIPPKPKEPERKRKVSTSVKDEKAAKPEEKAAVQSPVKKSRPTPAKVDETPPVLKPVAIKKMTPTKAQQKLFEPVMPLKVAVQPPKKFKVKRCMVRLRQDNLEKLQKQHVCPKERRGRPKKIQVAQKRKMTKGNTSEQDSPPAKKQRSPQTEKNKPTAGFFIKLTTSPSTGYGSKRNNNKKSPPKADKPHKSSSSSSSSSSSPLTTPSKNHHKKSSTKDKSLAASKKLSSHTPKSTTKPTKFTRTQLIKAFGKRYFRSRVKIERCKHPMMLTFESNARARRLQTKRNKSKNLSVSFREQVEIFGDYDSESDADNESEADASMNASAAAETSSASSTQAAGAMQKSFPSNPMPVTPARLKKVENGKLIDDIELDPSLFIDPTCAASSTPFASPGRKKREKKSYSVLKGDGTPSPRKEQLKLANEKLPPSGLRRLNIDMDDDDDEDDDCEYIVPIEIPQRRMSRANSGVDVAEVDAPIAENFPQQVNKVIEDTTSKNPASDSSNSFNSALSNAAAPPLTGAVEDATDEGHVDETNKATPVQDEIEESEVNAAATNNIGATLTPLTDTDTPPPLLSTLTDLVDAAINNGDELLETNEDDDNLDDIVSNKLGSALDGTDLPLNLFVEDSTQNSEFLDDSVVQKSAIVDSIVNETIDNLSKDIEMAETNALTKISPAALKPTSAISKTARASE